MPLTLAWPESPDTIVIPADVAIAGTEPIDESNAVLSQILLDKCVVIQRDDIQLFRSLGSWSDLEAVRTRPRAETAALRPLLIP